MGRVFTVIRPAKTSSIAKTVANMGRSIKNFENIAEESWLFLENGIHFFAVTHSEEGLGDILIARFHTLSDKT